MRADFVTACMPGNCRASRILFSRNMGRPSLSMAASGMAMAVISSNGRQAREEFWRAKIGANIQRDAKNIAALLDAGWRVATIWECGLRCKGGPEAAVEQLSDWLISGETGMEVRG